MSCICRSTSLLHEPDTTVFDIAHWPQGTSLSGRKHAGYSPCRPSTPPAHHGGCRHSLHPHKHPQCSFLANNNLPNQLNNTWWPPSLHRGCGQPHALPPNDTCPAGAPSAKRPTPAHTMLLLRRCRTSATACTAYHRPELHQRLGDPLSSPHVTMYPHPVHCCPALHRRTLTGPFLPAHTAADYPSHYASAKWLASSSITLSTSCVMRAPHGTFSGSNMACTWLSTLWSGSSLLDQPSSTSVVTTTAQMWPGRDTCGVGTEGGERYLPV